MHHVPVSLLSKTFESLFLVSVKQLASHIWEKAFGHPAENASGPVASGLYAQMDGAIKIAITIKLVKSKKAWRQKEHYWQQQDTATKLVFRMLSAFLELEKKTSLCPLWWYFPCMTLECWFKTVCLIQSNPLSFFRSAETITASTMIDEIWLHSHTSLQLHSKHDRYWRLSSTVAGWCLKDRILFIPQFRARETRRPHFIALQLHPGIIKRQASSQTNWAK